MITSPLPNPKNSSLHHSPLHLSASPKVFRSSTVSDSIGYAQSLNHSTDAIRLPITSRLTLRYRSCLHNLLFAFCHLWLQISCSPRQNNASASTRYKAYIMHSLAQGLASCMVRYVSFPQVSPKIFVLRSPKCMPNSLLPVLFISTVTVLY